MDEIPPTDTGPSKDDLDVPDDIKKEIGEAIERRREAEFDEEEGD